MPPSGAGRQDRVLSELPLYVWLQAIRVHPWIIRAAMLHPEIHRALNIAKLQGQNNPIFIMSAVGSALSKENERLRTELINAITYGRVFIPKPK